MRIVIIGGGFGGVYTAKQLIHRAPQNVEIILIDEKDYVLYTPMLHEVATGGLQPRMVMEPLRNILHGPNFQLYTGRAEQIDFRRREILTDKGTVPYDIVVIATGSEPNFFLPGAAQYALPLKTLTDAKHIRNKIVETMHLIPKPVVTVVGGGPTGVEIMGELVEFCEQLGAQTKFVLLHAADQLIPQAHPENSAKALERLRHMGVDVQLNTKAKKITRGKIHFNGTILQSDLILWTAGVKPRTLPGIPAIANPQGRYPVDAFLRIIGTHNAYAIGDCAAIMNPDGTLVPDLAQSAVVEGYAVARNILAELGNGKSKPFVFRQKGFLVSVGRFGIAEIGPFRFSGFFAWWLMRTIYLFKMIGTVQKLRVAWEWTARLFKKRDTMML